MLESLFFWFLKYCCFSFLFFSLLYTYKYIHMFFSGGWGGVNRGGINNVYDSSEINREQLALPYCWQRTVLVASPGGPLSRWHLNPLCVHLPLLFSFARGPCTELQLVFLRKKKTNKETLLCFSFCYSSLSFFPRLCACF